ncbi:MAG: hypothetical protein GX883_03515, partial [Firmicutes bacterium]|nr:hypothetical protein [Bacillota bacterium]
MTKKEHTVILILLAVVIVFALSNLFSINSLSDNLAGIQGNMNNLRRELSGEISNVFQAIQEQTSWGEFEEIEIVELGAEQISIKIGCYIREYRQGSTVLINYRRGSENYTALEAEEDAGGHFHALLNLDFKPEPQWMHHYSQAALSGTNSPPEQVILGYPDFVPEEQYEYYISVVDGDLVRTGKPESIPLDKVGYLYYSSLDSQIEVEKNSVSVWLMEVRSEQQFVLTGARLELCRDGRVVDQLPLSSVE